MMDIVSCEQQESPEQILLQWLRELPPLVCHSLVMRFILMTSQDSGDFTLSGQEGCEHFASYLGEPDFALRRLARTLTVRSVFDFILEQQDELMSAGFAVSPEIDIPSFDTAQILRVQKSWRELCRHRLSNEQLLAWLQAQPG